MPGSDGAAAALVIGAVGGRELIGDSRSSVTRSDRGTKQPTELPIEEAVDGALRLDRADRVIAAGKLLHRDVPSTAEHGLTPVPDQLVVERLIVGEREDDAAAVGGDPIDGRGEAGRAVAPAVRPDRRNPVADRAPDACE